MENAKVTKSEVVIGVGLILVAIAALAAPSDLLQFIFTGVGRIH